MLVEEILGRIIYCVIHIMLLSCQEWVKPHSVEEVVRSVFENVIASKEE